MDFLNFENSHSKKTIFQAYLYGKLKKDIKKVSSFTETNSFEFFQCFK